MSQSFESCRNCGDNTLYETSVSAGGGSAPNYLPQLGTFWTTPKFTVRVCESCGDTQLIAPPEARAKLAISSKWRKI